MEGTKLKIFEVLYDVHIKRYKGQKPAELSMPFICIYKRLKPIAYRRQNSVWYFTSDTSSTVEAAMIEAKEEMLTKYGADCDWLIYEIATHESQKIRDYIYNASCIAAKDLLTNLIQKIEELEIDVKRTIQEKDIAVQKKVSIIRQEFAYIQNIFILFELENKPVLEVIQLFNRVSANYHDFRGVLNDLQKI